MSTVLANKVCLNQSSLKPQNYTKDTCSTSLSTGINTPPNDMIVYDFLGTVKAATHECEIRTGLP